MVRRSPTCFNCDDMTVSRAVPTARRSVVAYSKMKRKLKSSIPKQIQQLTPVKHALQERNFEIKIQEKKKEVPLPSARYPQLWQFLFRLEHVRGENQELEYI